MNIFGFDTDKAADYENGFYLTSSVPRLAKALAHYELYKRIVNLPGHVVECGVFKGTSMVRWATYREVLESPHARRIIGFDTFADFPETGYADDQAPRERFIAAAGSVSMTVEELQQVMTHKGVRNVELVAGDILETVPRYVQQNPAFKIALLHIDTDIYEPAKAALEALYDRIVPGGLLVLDDYGLFPGETKAVDEFFAGRTPLFQKLPLSHDIPVFVVKR
jgi:hypothetical protein